MCHGMGGGRSLDVHEHALLREQRYVLHRVRTEELCDGVLGAGLPAVHDAGVPEQGPVTR